ncbi:RING-type E3 ubiquitin-protein ligase PPIL2 [Oxyura jamaicensis]|uniref:RING-type E3 ubiquitin-protein ligase PPIL2 n=1 Tax=Oxyura jamaicensis TaxID=8884 RepID=UPI0015A6F8AB|nr:RING-type E3 ubiquitin-protein ligase PPIL2 [Oxyura jamaicensis]
MKLLKPTWVNHNGKPIFSVDIHPDGTKFATGGQGQDSGKVVIWNMAPVLKEEDEKNENIPKMLCQMDNHLACVNCVRWSNNGVYLASGGDDKLIMVWKRAAYIGPSTVFGSSSKLTNVEQWRCVSILRSHSGDVMDVAWSPHDAWLASCSVDNTVVIWNAVKFPGEESSISDVRVCKALEQIMPCLGFATNCSAPLSANQYRAHEFQEWILKLDAKSLIKLNFAKNSEGKYHCPVLFTVFTNNSHIVAIKTTGNVFAYEAVEQLNIKPKSYKDLLTDEPFTRQDIVTLQDPTNLDKFNVSNFFHVKNNIKVVDPDEEKAKLDPSYYLKNTNAETRETLLELYKEFKGDDILAATMKAPEKKKVDKLNAAHYSTGAVSASFTSTAMVPETTHEAAAIDEDVVRYKYVKKKGYVRLHTNKGDLNLELHCDMTPRTCENFIKLCKKNYYDGTIFHRSIRNFVIQGGDPTGTGTGGESYWGKPFKDEFKPNLSHTGRGVLSMANSGPNTNKSQFFITFRSCAYLDKKHTVFGRVVGGFETLTAMENVESDPKTDRPKEEIRIQSTTVFVDPYEEADAQVAAEREKAQQEEEAAKTKAEVIPPKKEVQTPKTYRQGIGKYINMAAVKRSVEDDGPSTSTAVKKEKKSTGFGDFSSW